MNGSIQTGNTAPLNFSVSNVPNSTMSFEKKIVQYGSVTGDPVIFELVYQNN